MSKLIDINSIPKKTKTIILKTNKVVLTFLKIEFLNLIYIKRKNYL